MTDKPALKDIDRKWREHTILDILRRINTSIDDIHELQGKGYDSPALKETMSLLRDARVEIDIERRNARSG